MKFGYCRLSLRESQHCVWHGLLVGRALLPCFRRAKADIHERNQRSCRDHLVHSVCFAVLVCAGGVRPALAGEPTALFDGKTLEGWDVIACQASVKEEAILLESGNGLVQTKKQYGDFVLEYEWKALKADNWDSGVYFRYGEVPAGSPWPERYQVNLRQGGEGDLVGFPNGKNNIPTKAGEWNRFELTAKGTTASLAS